MSIPLGAVLKPQPRWLVADWLGFESKPVTPADDRVPSQDQYYFHSCITATSRRQEPWSRGSIPPFMTWKSKHGVHRADGNPNL